MPWQAHDGYGGYLDEHIQTALLNLETELAKSRYWQGTADLEEFELEAAAGTAFMNLIAVQLQQCDNIVRQRNDI